MCPLRPPPDNNIRQRAGSLPRLHRRIFLPGPLAVRPGIGPRIFVAEDLEHDRRERRPRATVSIGVDLMVWGDSPGLEESL